MLKALIREVSGFRAYMKRMYDMFKIHNMLDIQNVDFVSVRPLSENEYLITASEYSFAEIKANIKKREMQADDWFSVIDKAEAEHNAIIEAEKTGVKFNGMETEDFVQYALDKSYRTNAVVSDLGDAGYGNHNYVISL